MIEKTVYVCDICGKEFADEYECETHEWQERAKPFIGRFKIVYFNGNKDSYLPSGEQIDSIKAIYTKDKETAKFLDKYFFSYYGSFSESPYCGMSIQNDMTIFYDEESTCSWLDLDEEYAKLDRIKELF